MKTILRMFEQVRWANARILARLREAGTVSPKIRTLMTHTLQAERVWLTRLQGKDSNHLELWAELPLAECLELAERNALDYETYLAGLTEADLDRSIDYRNQTGKSYRTRIGDILAHVAMHGQYHRGQINLLLRQDGEEPINVDLIMYVRETSQLE